ncbi:MAG: DUF1365 family protein [Desulfobacter sp.]|nr:DUF1365 family protein [Desulfobacter sp.]
MNSKIYRGSIAHRRYLPVNHELCYPIYIFAFDLDDLARLNQRYPLFGYNRKAVTSIHDKDYLHPSHLPLKDKIITTLARHGITTPIAGVTTITSARYFNYVFNPVSFHYCFSRDQKLSAIIAEVNNTYGERHPYVLTKNICPPDNWFASFQTPKVFHVSPFNKIQGMYYFYFSDLSDQLEIKIELVNDNKKIMEAVLKGESRPLTVSNHLKTMIKYPAAPHLSVPRIYAHAFKLFFQKKLPFNNKPVPGNPMTLIKQTPGWVERICKRLVIQALKKMSAGYLKIEMPDNTPLFFGDPNDRPMAVMKIQDNHFFQRLVFDGEIGFGEAFMASEWETPDLVGLLMLLITNRDQFSDGNFMLSFITRVQEKIAHDRRRNTIENTTENIRDHYDLSNEFYALFLDRQMLYSCGIFKTPQESLEQAQENKMVRILEQADVQKDHHILEIGCGWGGFAVFAAKQTGCRVTGITVSQAQYDRACQRVKDEGLEDKITIERQDYRHTRGQFDRIISIEMIEAVGPQFLSTYFQQAQKLLKPGGRMVFQAIIIQDERYAQYCRERDWIQKHIFPGGHLPCLKVLNQTLSAHTDFKIADVYHMGPHYATTLDHWQQRFVDRSQEISRMGFNPTFRRKWQYYFSICQAGFIVGGIDNIQMRLTL